MSRPRTASPREDLLPLHEGDSGRAVVDLQERLGRLGFEHGDDQLGAYGPGTAASVQMFQGQRGLRGDGVCDHETWSSLVEAGFRLGDRLLYRHSPMLQGDDVAEVQRRLSGLGFDPGGVDGIFGDNTHAAITEFQHNMGLLTDGICGPVTLSELKRVAPVRGGSDLVSPLREQLRVAAAPATLSCKKIAVGEEGGFATGVAAVHRALLRAGAQSLELHDPDPLAQAQAANTAQVDCYIGLRLEPSHESVKTYFYRGFRYESAASRHLAELLLQAAANRLDMPEDGAHGMADVILRRTVMPAVVLELGAPHQVAMKTSGIARAVQQSLELWLTTSEE
ncbi:MAG: peptidoglycan-binding domain-containing protein [Acidimicrobiales bacterium]